ncbi:MAG: 1-phosphofructokinase, partial [Ignavibacteriales bacterium]
MILSVTIHPLLEKRLTYNKIVPGTSHRNPVQEFKPGGKGINVCRQLNKFNIKNLAFTFLGGNN